jgi:hypothetical protein
LFVLSLVLIPMILIFYLNFKYEIKEIKRPKSLENAFIQAVVVSSSIVITTLWAGQLVGPEWTGTFELLLALFVLVVVESLTYVDDWRMMVFTKLLVMGSGIA